MRWLLLLVTSTGCELLFPREDRISEPPVDVRLPDTDGGVLNPPATADDCTGTLPPFESYRFGETPFPFAGAGVVEFSFYESAGALRSIVLADDDRIYDVSADGTAVALPGLDPPEFASMHGLHVTSDGVALWFVQDGVADGVYFGTAASGWTRRHADLGFPNAERVEPGAIAYFASAARMVVSVTVSGIATLHELESHDGEHWTALSTIVFAPSPLGDRHPALSPDGCTLLYTASDGTNEIRIATRGPDGRFINPRRVDAISVKSSAPGNPVITPDQDALWFTSNVAGILTTFRGAP